MVFGRHIVATSILSGYKNIVAIFNPSKSGNRITILKNIAEQIGNVDFAISFRTSFYSAVLQFFHIVNIELLKFHSLIFGF